MGFVQAGDLGDGATVHADLAIIGSGAAGITLAQELAPTGANIAVIESGGYEHDPSRRGLDRGDWIGDIGVGVASRKRFLGGSTNCWGGNCSPMDPWDYLERDWIEHSGWPFTAADLDPYIGRAHDLLRLGPDTFSVKAWADRMGRVEHGLILKDSPRVQTKLFQRSHVARFGELYRRDLERSSNVTVYLDTHVVELLADVDGTQVTGARLISSDGAKSLTLDASTIVLGAAIENSRLLLTSHREGGGLGNHHDQVGRYFMGHFHFVSGRLEPSQELGPVDLYTLPGDVLSYVPGSKSVIGALQPTAAVQREERIMNTSAFLLPYRPHEHWAGRSRAAAVGRGTWARVRSRPGPRFGVRDVYDGARGVPAVVGHGIGEGCRRMVGARWYGVRSWTEQAPDPDNRIVLTDEVDRFGVPRLAVRSNLTPLDRRTLVRGQEIIGEELEAAGLGRLVVELPRGDRWPAGTTGTSHFMGGTRMHPDPAHGVVDVDSKVHGVDNLYVTGASVFPSSGLGMATYHLVLLALRLADHLRSKTG